MTSEIFVYLHSPARFSSWFDVLIATLRSDLSMAFQSTCLAGAKHQGQLQQFSRSAMNDSVLQVPQQLAMKFQTMRREVARK